MEKSERQNRDNGKSLRHQKFIAFMVIQSIKNAQTPILRQLNFCHALDITKTGGYTRSDLKDMNIKHDYNIDFVLCHKEDNKIHTIIEVEENEIRYRTKNKLIECAEGLPTLKNIIIVLLQDDSITYWTIKKSENGKYDFFNLDSIFGIKTEVITNGFYIYEKEGC